MKSHHDIESAATPSGVLEQQQQQDHHEQDKRPSSPRPASAASASSSLLSLTMLHKALRLGRVEEKGIQPLPVDERTSTRFFNIFTVWFSMNSNILAITFGLLGPSVYGMGLRDSALVILFFTLLCTVAPAYLATLGPKTGMRQMVQARYSFG
jgi:cytosine/uracil/thiamine/allantoin permease